MERPFWDTGTIVSASAHGALLVWLVVGNVFRSEPLPMEVQSVSVVSFEEFAALSAPVPAPRAPEVATEVAVPAPEPEPTPDPVAAPEPEPQAQAVPEPAQPQPPEDVAVLPPDVSTPPPPAERVAPEAVPEPAPEAREDTQVQEAITEDSTGEAQQEPQEATAPQEATTEIVTEADERTLAPTASPRPPSQRPTRPTVVAEPEPAVEPTPRTDPVAEAIAEALANNTTPPTEPTPPTQPTAPSGPPLTGSEREGLRVAVSSCWNVGALSSEAQETKVTVLVEMNENGTPRGETIRMISSSGGSSASANSVFETARRAILRCGARGFPLPVEKYAQWREIEMTFDPEGMFWR